MILFPLTFFNTITSRHLYSRKSPFFTIQVGWRTMIVRKYDGALKIQFFLENILIYINVLLSIILF